MGINIERPAWALALIACLFLAMWQCQGKRAAELETTTALNAYQQLQKDTSDLKAQVRAARAIGATIRKESHDRRVKDSIQHRADMAVNRALSGKLTIARKDIQPIADTSAIVQRFVEISDSTIAQRDSTIRHMEISFMVQQDLHAREMGAMSQENVKLVELNDTYERFITKQSKDLVKAERGKRFWKAVGIGASSAAVVLGLVASQ